MFQQLRQFVHGGGTHQTPDACHAWIAGNGLNRADAALGILNHRPELERVEHASTLAYSGLRVKDRSRGLELDGCREQRPEGRGKDQACTRQDDIEGSFCTHARPAPASAATGTGWSTTCSTIPLNDVSMRAFENCDRALAAAPSRSRTRSKRSVESRRIASARPSASPGSTTSPLTPCWFTQGTPVGKFVLMTGRPAAIAST